jgi:hypothetical protein
MIAPPARFGVIVRVSNPERYAVSEEISVPSVRTNDRSLTIGKVGGERPICILCRNCIARRSR